jgi:hypothetical protein
VDGWRKSSYSGANGSCVETASGDSVVLVRDATNRVGGMLTFTAEARAAGDGPRSGPSPPTRWRHCLYAGS